MTKSPVDTPINTRTTSRLGWLRPSWPTVHYPAAVVSEARDVTITRRHTLSLLAAAIAVGGAGVTSACSATAPSSAGTPGGSATSLKPSTAPLTTGPPASITPAGGPATAPATSRAPAPGVPRSAPARADIVARYAGLAPREWGLEPTGIVQALGTTGVRDKAVALTFDLCGGPTPTSGGNGYDADLVELLRRHDARATFFVNARWARANPRLMDQLIADPRFEIGNHGTQHLPLSVSGRKGYTEQGTHNPGEVYDEVMGNTELLTQLTGHAPRWFRSGTAHYDEIAVKIVGDLGQRCIGFTVNGDAGTTFTAPQVVSAVRTAKAGDIVISHANRPPAQTAEGYAVALPALLARGLRCVTLSDYLTG